MPKEIRNKDFFSQGFDASIDAINNTVSLTLLFEL
jgi:hypothetical protein